MAVLVCLLRFSYDRIVRTKNVHDLRVYRKWSDSGRTTLNTNVAANTSVFAQPYTSVEELDRLGKNHWDVMYRMGTYVPCIPFPFHLRVQRATFLLFVRLFD